MPPWVAGLRDDRYEVTNSGEWLEVLAVWILGRRSSLKQNPDALDAQQTLGLPPSDYWFIGRARRFFGPDAVMLWRPVFGHPNLPDGGVCPFDTGLLTNVDVPYTLAPGTDPRTVFENHQKPLARWRDALLQHLSRAYGNNHGDYVRGSRPQVLVDEIVAAAKPSLDDARWTWEGRIAKTDSDRSVIPSRLFLRKWWRPQLDEWLVDPASRLDAADAATVSEWLAARLDLCTEPAWVAANDRILADLGDRAWDR